MDASTLLHTLLKHTPTNSAALQALYDKLPPDTTIADFRNKIVEDKLLTYQQVMNAFHTHFLIPKSQLLLSRLEERRKNTTTYQPMSHQQKFHIDESVKLATMLHFTEGNLEIRIPEPDLKRMKFSHSDETQAVMLAAEMAKMDELTESEIILLETITPFPESIAAKQVLCWVYLSSKLYSQAEHWANRIIIEHYESPLTVMLLALIEQAQDKHLLAISHYQKLLRLDHVVPIWYLLLAYSQQQSFCPREAKENYKIYYAIGKEKIYLDYAEHQIKEL